MSAAKFARSSLIVLAVIINAVIFFYVGRKYQENIDLKVVIELDKQLDKSEAQTWKAIGLARDFSRAYDSCAAKNGKSRQ